jgi:hypothetical protein
LIGMESRDNNLAEMCLTFLYLPQTLTPSLFIESVCTKPGCWAIMHLCLRGFDFFPLFMILLLNCLLRQCCIFFLLLNCLLRQCCIFFLLLNCLLWQCCIFFLLLNCLLWQCCSFFYYWIVYSDNAVVFFYYWIVYSDNAVVFFTIELFTPTML